MRDVINLFRKNPLYLLVLVAPMLETIWGYVTGINIIDLLTGVRNSTFWISVVTLITFVPGSIIVVFSSKWTSYKTMPYLITIEAAVQAVVAFYIGYNIENIQPHNLAFLQFIIVVANAIATPCIFMLGRDVLKPDQLRTGSAAESMSFGLTSFIGLALAPLAKFQLNLSCIFYIEGVLTLWTAWLLFITFIKVPRRKSIENLERDKKISELSNLKFLKVIFNEKKHRILFFLPSMLYFAMVIPTVGLAVWVNQNLQNIPLAFVIYYSFLLWARILGQFGGPLVFQKYYPKRRQQSLNIIIFSIFLGSLLYAVLGLSITFNIVFAFALISIAHLFSNYAYAAIWYEIDCLGEGAFAARLQSWISAINAIFLGLGPFIIAFYGDRIGVKNLWLINFLCAVPLGVFCLAWIRTLNIRGRELCNYQD